MKFKCTVVFLGAFLLALCGAGPLYAAQQVKIGYFDLGEVLQRSEAGKDVDKEMSDEVDSVKKEVKKFEDEFSKKRSEFDSKSLLWGKEIREKKLKELIGMEKELVERRRAAEMRLRQIQRRLTTPLIRDINDILEKVGKRGGYSIIFEKGQAGIFYAPGAFDLTDQIIKEFNVLYEKKKK